MDTLKRMFGMGAPAAGPSAPARRRQPMSQDELAVERYRYLLQTAPPDTIEEAHVEAFSKLTPEQRQMVRQELDQTLTPAERESGAVYDDEPRSLARLATRAEMRQPGTLERTWKGMPAMSPAGGMGGGMMMNSFMGSFAGIMLGSMVADAFLGDFGGDAAATDMGGAEMGDAGSLEGGDFGGDAGGFGDFGGDFGDFGDFGGGDF